MKFNGKRISYGVLHSSIHVPNVGSLGPTLSGEPTSAHKPYKMTVQEPFVLLEASDFRTKESRTIAIPLTWFTHMEFYKE